MKEEKEEEEEEEEEEEKEEEEEEEEEEKGKRVEENLSKVAVKSCMESMVGMKGDRNA